MKLTKDYLKKVIKEEYSRLLIEQEQSAAEQAIINYQNIINKVEADLGSLKTFRQIEDAKAQLQAAYFQARHAVNKEMNEKNKNALLDALSQAYNKDMEVSRLMNQVKDANSGGETSAFPKRPMERSRVAPPEGQ